MSIRRKLLIGIMAISVLPISAQEQRIKEPEKISFKPHWFIQAQIGAAHTVGEAKFTDLISPAAALNVGYKFAPAFGARVGVSGWQAKGGWVNPQQTYQYKYLQGNVDIMADLSTLFCGFNPKRVFNGYLFAGAGLNRGFDNDEANALDTRTYEMEYLWQEGKFLVAGRFRHIRQGMVTGVIGSFVLAVFTGLTLWYEMPIAYFETALFLNLIFGGLVLPTSTALALDSERQNAGAASAVFGAVSFLAGGIVSPLVGIGNILHTTAIIMVVSSAIAVLMIGGKKNAASTT